MGKSAPKTIRLKIKQENKHHTRSNTNLPKTKQAQIQIQKKFNTLNQTDVIQTQITAKLQVDRNKTVVPTTILYHSYLHITKRDQLYTCTPKPVTINSMSNFNFRCKYTITNGNNNKTNNRCIKNNNVNFGEKYLINILFSFEFHSEGVCLVHTMAFERILDCQYSTSNINVSIFSNFLCNVSQYLHQMENFQLRWNMFIQQC